MTKQIQYLGGITHGHIILENSHEEIVWFGRELWFDRDIDGRWLVGVTTQRPSGEETTGAIVVKDATVGAFIQLLGKLVADPEQFADQPLTIGPAWDARLPAD